MIEFYLSAPEGDMPSAVKFITFSRLDIAKILSRSEEKSNYEKLTSLRKFCWRERENCSILKRMCDVGIMKIDP